MRDELGAKLSPEELENLEKDKQFYRLESSQGLYLQGSSGVVNQIVDDETVNNDPLGREIAEMKTMSQLAENVRKY